jgi:hypothetical protein
MEAKQDSTGETKADPAQHALLPDLPSPSRKGHDTQAEG